jgi:hypothetical protein
MLRPHTAEQRRRRAGERRRRVGLLLALLSRSRAARRSEPRPAGLPDRGSGGDLQGANPARPDPERDGVSPRQVIDLCRLAEERFGIVYGKAACCGW